MTEADIVYLAANLRQADVDEVVASGYDDMAEAIRVSVEASTHSAVVTCDGVPAAVLGLVPVSLLAGIGAPWMLGTDVVTRQQRALMHLTGRYLRTMLKAYPTLVNYVHARNTVAIRWLRRVGFEIGPAEPYGPRGELFRIFTMKV